MKPMIPSALALVLAAAATGPAAAALKDAKWGMSPAEVVAAVGGNAELYRDSTYGTNGRLGVTSMETSEGRDMPVAFHFTDKPMKLVDYEATIPGGFEMCQAMRRAFDTRYGAPFHTSGSPDDGWITSVWYDPARPSQVELHSIGDGEEAICRLTYMDEMAANARDAQGLTRNEGNPTPRADYRPYRQAQ